MNLKLEIETIKKLIKKSKENDGCFDYTLQVRQGEIKRTILAEVYNGTDFDD